MLSFAPTHPTTYEENEGQIHRVQAKLEDALERRDFEAAKKMKQKLDYCLNVRAWCIKQSNQRDQRSELDRLEKQRQQEEEELKKRMSERSQKILAQYQQRYEQMERKHQEEIRRLEMRFNDPSFGSLKKSPYITSMHKAEDYYAKQSNYVVANAYKDQIFNRTNTEMDMTDLNSNQTVQAKIELSVTRYEKELEGFRARLENEKNKMKFDTQRALTILRNKYGKLRRRVLGIDDDDPLPESARNEGRGVFQKIDYEFSPMLGTIGLAAVTPTPPTTARDLPSMKSTRLYNTLQNTGCYSARNPRVQRALELSIAKRENVPV